MCNWLRIAKSVLGAYEIDRHVVRAFVVGCVLIDVLQSRMQLVDKS